jgi:hypothetical protein
MLHDAGLLAVGLSQACFPYVLGTVATNANADKANEAFTDEPCDILPEKSASLLIATRQSGATGFDVLSAILQKMGLESMWG